MDPEEKKKVNLYILILDKFTNRLKNGRIGVNWIIQRRNSI